MAWARGYIADGHHVELFGVEHTAVVLGTFGGGEVRVLLLALSDGSVGMGDGHNFDVGELGQGFEHFADVAFDVDEAEADFPWQAQCRGGGGGKRDSRSCKDMATRVPHSKDCVTRLVQSRRNVEP
ncbi:MAG: hypothetical protein U0R19_24470 [Bryobacteraceae bacterium]